MGSSTFTGPIKSGTILNTTGTTVGTDIANVGYTVMSQTSASMTQATANTATSIVLPSNSQIIGLYLFVTTVFNNSPTTFNVGNSVTPDLYCDAQTIGTSTGRIVLVPDATNEASWIDIGTSDVRLTVSSTVAGTGVFRLVSVYAQGINLS